MGTFLTALDNPCGRAVDGGAAPRYLLRLGTGGRSSAVERRLPKPQVVGSIPIARLLTIRVVPMVVYEAGTERASSAGTILGTILVALGGIRRGAGGTGAENGAGGGPGITLVPQRVRAVRRIGGRAEKFRLEVPLDQLPKLRVAGSSPVSRSGLVQDPRYGVVDPRMAWRTRAWRDAWFGAWHAWFKAWRSFVWVSLACEGHAASGRRACAWRPWR
jgi:hypothetical protein